jgi:hypothetical protein
MTVASWTLLVLLLIALVFTLGAAAGRLPLWPAVLLVILVELVAGRAGPIVLP